MSINSSDQSERTQQRSGAAFQGQDKANQANEVKQRNQAEKAKGDKARKEKKKKVHREK